mgnify:CR=1 FL=1
MNERLGLWQLGTFGLQHVLAMYGGAVVVPLIVGPAIGLNEAEVAYLISIDLFTCGIATLLQVVGNKFFGIRMPILMGCAFQAVGPMIAIGTMQGVQAVFGAIIAAGAIVIFLAQFMTQIIRFFPPVVTGTVVIIIGTSLIGAAMDNITGQPDAPNYASLENLFLAAMTLIIIVLLNRYFQGFMKAISILVSLIAGTIIAAFMGLVDLSSVASASWFHMVTPFRFGLPEFHLSAIFSMVLVGIVSMIEATGVYFALAEVIDKKLDGDDIKRGLRAEGLAQIIGGIFQAFPYTTFSQNVGIVALTKVKERKVVVASGIILLALGLLPKVAALTLIIPDPVLGGAMIAMFGMVMSSGIRQLSVVDFRRTENALIVAIAVGLGLGVSIAPEVFSNVPQSIRILVENGIVTGGFAAVILNVVLNGIGQGRDKELKSDHDAGTVVEGI